MQLAGDSLVSEAIDLVDAGNIDADEVMLRQALESDPANPTTNRQLGLLAYSRGDLPGAQYLFTQAVIADPDNPEHSNNLGVVLNARGDTAVAKAAFEAAIRLKPDFAEAHNNLGVSHEAQGDAWSAIQAFQRALELDPGYVEARDNLDLARARVAPPWHFPMMADRARNSAYDAALRRAAPGRRVLDIGTGAGLLAMMAARAGAADVVTCEMVAAVATAAKQVIESNGYADRVTVHSKHSGQLRIGPDLPARADILVTETFSSGVLSESILPTIEFAREHLLTPSAQVIPHKAAAIGYLIGGAVIEAHLFAPRSDGFDLKPFDIFAPNKVGLHLDRIPHQILSDDFEILGFDLTQSVFHAQRKAFSVTATSAGRCVGVAQWLKLDLDAETTYENRPNQEASANGWMHVLYRFREPVEVKGGEVISLVASHNRMAMTVTAVLSG